MNFIMWSAIIPLLPTENSFYSDNFISCLIKDGHVLKNKIRFFWLLLCKLLVKELIMCVKLIVGLIFTKWNGSLSIEKMQKIDCRRF